MDDPQKLVDQVLGESKEPSKPATPTPAPTPTPQPSELPKAPVPPSPVPSPAPAQDKVPAELLGAPTGGQELPLGLAKAKPAGPNQPTPPTAPPPPVASKPVPPGVVPVPPPKKKSGKGMKGLMAGLTAIMLFFVIGGVGYFWRQGYFGAEVPGVNILVDDLGKGVVIKQTVKEAEKGKGTVENTKQGDRRKFNDSTDLLNIVQEEQDQNKKLEADPNLTIDEVDNDIYDPTSQKFCELADGTGCKEGDPGCDCRDARYSDHQNVAVGENCFGPDGESCAGEAGVCKGGVCVPAGAGLSIEDACAGKANGDYICTREHVRIEGNIAGDNAIVCTGDGTGYTADLGDACAPLVTPGANCSTLTRQSEGESHRGAFVGCSGTQNCFCPDTSVPLGGGFSSGTVVCYDDYANDSCGRDYKVTTSTKPPKDKTTTTMTTTPTPSPSPSPSPSPTPTLACTSLTKNKADSAIEIGTNVTFTCAGAVTPAGATSLSYTFRISKDGGNWQTLPGTGTTASYAVATAGTYKVQCKVCGTINNASVCDPTWGSAQ